MLSQEQLTTMRDNAQANVNQIVMRLQDINRQIMDLSRQVNQLEAERSQLRDALLQAKAVTETFSLALGEDQDAKT